MIRRVALAVLVAAVLVPAPVSAFHCSGRSTPPQEYRDRGTKVHASGWYLHHSAEDGWVGVHYTDGYLYADAGDPRAITVRAFVPFWPHFADVSVDSGDPSEACVEFGHGQP